MKIDLHLHTKICKSGDPDTREVTKEKFKEKLNESEIKVAAITNHNEFDLDQFNSFNEFVKEEIILWPGVEFDIENKCLPDEKIKNGHILVICDSQDRNIFKSKVDDLCQSKHPDNIVIAIEDICDKFKDLKTLFIIHYKKSNELTEDSIISLKNNLGNNNILLYEPSNLRAAKILVKENKNIIVGTDIRDWDNYYSIAHDRVPDTKFNIENFSKFFNVLNRDITTINSIFDGYQSTKLENIKMPEGDSVSLKIYRDLNVVYGDKGTGKSVLLEGISNCLRDMGYSAIRVIKPNEKNLKDTYQLSGLHAKKAFTNLKYDNCEVEIKETLEFSTIDVTPIVSYLTYFKSKQIKSNADKIKLNELQTILFETDQNVYNSMLNILDFIDLFIENISNEISYNKIFNEKDVTKINEFKVWFTNKVNDSALAKFKDIKVIECVNNLIQFYQKSLGEISANTESPNSTNFYKYASHKLKLKLKLEKIFANLELESTNSNDLIGELNKKGKIYYSEKIVFSLKNIVGFYSFNELTKENIFKIRSKLLEIYESLFTSELHTKLNELNTINSDKKFVKLDDLLIFQKRFLLEDGSYYLPSDGESAIITLRNELKKNSEFYIIDEPEKSMGNLIINNEIMPEINKLIMRGKHVVITTHDANLAVRTMPVQTIYRLHENGKYRTFVGNLFSNTLIDNKNNKLSWNETSLNIFEGGEIAFKEREYIYDFEGM